MRLLLDTHTLLWLVSGDVQLSKTATDMLIDPSNDLLISPATYWELAIKSIDWQVSTGRPVGRLHRRSGEIVRAHDPANHSETCRSRCATAPSP